MLPNDESIQRSGTAGDSALPLSPEGKQLPGGVPVPAQAEGDGRADGPAAQVSPRRAGASPNEFTFGWSDVEAGQDLPLSGGHKKAQPRRELNGAVQSSADGAPSHAGPALAQQLAEQAVRTPDRVGAAGLVAAAAGIAAESAVAPSRRLRRALPHIVRAAAWIAWRLHPHPTRRNLLALLPASVSLCAEAVCARAGEEHSLQTGWVASVLYRQAQQVAAERAAQPAHMPPQNGGVHTGPFADSTPMER